MNGHDGEVVSRSAGFAFRHRAAIVSAGMNPSGGGFMGFRSGEGDLAGVAR